MASGDDYKEYRREDDDDSGNMDRMENLAENENPDQICGDRFHTAEQGGVRAADGLCGVEKDQVRNHCRNGTEQKDVDACLPIRNRIEGDRAVFNHVVGENKYQCTQEDVEHRLEVVDKFHPGMVQEYDVPCIA